MSNPEPQEEKKLTHDPRYHWDREEHIILLDAYLRYRPQFPSSESNEIQEISRLLRQYHPQKGNPIHEKLRNGDGVYMKMMNFRRFDPTTESKGLPKGNKLEETIWNEYYDRQEELKATAELIKRSIKDGTSFPDNDQLDELEMESEGRVIGTIHKRHERSKKNKIEYQDQFGSWKHFQTKHNKADAFRVASCRAQSTGKRHQLISNKGQILDFVEP